MFHKNESPAAVAVIVVEGPQVVMSFPKLTEGLFTTTVTMSVQLTPFAETVQVYVVVCVGETLIVEVVAPLDHR